MVEQQLNKKSIVVCNSTSHMLRLDDLLTAAAVHHLLVPIPASIGDLCSVGVEVRTLDEDVVKGLINDHKVEVQGIFPIEKQVIPGLVELLQGKNLPIRLRTIVYKIQEDMELSLEEIEYLLTCKDKEQEMLFTVADYVRKKFVGDVVDVRAAIEFSNFCFCNCSYCGIRKENRNLNRFRMGINAIIEKAKEIASCGIKTVILQSGEDSFYTEDIIATLIKEIKKATGLRITLSIGERSLQEYVHWKKLGANNYLLKFETIKPELYEYLHPGEQLEQRLEHLRMIKGAGYLVGTGNIVGLPGQTALDIAKDILFMKEIGTGMAGIGPFVPTSNTPLASHPPGDIDMTLKTMAVVRIVLKNVFIPSTTALATLEPDAQGRGLQCGANSLMIISTPAEYRKEYKIYGNKMDVDLTWAKQIIEQVGRKLPKYLK